MYESLFENTGCRFLFYEEPFFLNSNENEVNDFFYNKEDDRKNFQDKTIFNNFEYYKFEERTQETNIKLSYNDSPKDLPKKEIVPSFCALNYIRELIAKNDDENRINVIIDKIKNDKTVLEAEEYLNSGKKITIDNCMLSSDNNLAQENSNDLEYEIKDNYLKIKRGRKSERNDGEEHDRYYADNIIKKIKAKLFDYCIKFINSIIFKNNQEGLQFLKIDYKYIDQLNRKKNMDLFEMPLIDLFSLDVSGKYKSKSKDYNKILINGILEQKIEVEDFDTILFLFKITLNDWIDLFTYKKDLLTLVKEYNSLNVNFIKIQNNFLGVNHLLNEISEKNDDKYYTLFLLYVFNFQRWFYIKKGRNHKKK